MKLPHDPAERFAVAAVALFCALALALIFIQPPINDETDYATPAVTLLRDGNWGSAVHEPKGDPRTGIELVTYYVLPGHPLALVPSVALFGVSLPAMRMKSLLFLLAAAALIFRVLQELKVPRGHAALAVGMLSLDRTWLGAASYVRPEAQVFVLAIGGASLFVRGIQLRRPGLGVLGGAMIAYAVLSHVNGLCFAFFCALVGLHAMRKDHRNPSIYAGALGVLLVLGVYCAFVLYRLDLFRAQMGWTSNTWERLDAWAHPVVAIGRELNRWIHLYATTVADLPRQIAYAAATAVSLAGLLLVLVRRRQGPGTAAAALGAMLAATVFAFAFFNNISSAFYFVYRSWLATVAVAIAAAFLPMDRRWVRVSWLAAVGLIIAVNLAKDAAYLKTSVEDGRRYRALEGSALNATRAEDNVTGPEELAFIFGMSRQYVVDDYFGFYSGRRPDVLLLQKAGAPTMTVTRSAIGGACAGDAEGRAKYERFYGPVVAAQIARDLPKLCAWFAALDEASRPIYEDAAYVLLRIDPAR